MKQANNLKTKYLIIGNSAGGMGAAEAIREIDQRGKLAIISDEPFPAYSRPLISEYVSHERILDTMLFRHPSFYEKNNINLLKGERVNRIDICSKTAFLADGKSITWKKLLLATGGVPIVPQLKGLDKRGVFKFIRLEDARCIDEYLAKVNHAVVIGGGLIGISVTEALVKRGIIATVIEMKKRVLNAILDEAASAAVENILYRKGINIITGHTVAEITGDGSVAGVVLEDGQRIACEMVVVAIGVIPNVELARGTEIRLNRGISVDRRMQTSVADVYACGDVAEAYDFVTGTNRLTPIWPNAYIGGRVAGCNMAGNSKEYLGGTAMNSINYFGIDIASAGLVSALDDKHFSTLTRQDDGKYRKIIIGDGMIKGMLFMKEIDKSGLVYGLMREGIDVTAFKHSLLQDDFGLIDLPAELRRRRLGTLTAGQHIVPVKEEEEQPVTGD